MASPIATATGTGNRGSDRIASGSLAKAFMMIGARTFFGALPAVQLFFADSYSGPVRGDLTHQFRDFVAIETHRQNRIATALHRGEPEPLDRLIPTIRQQLGVLRDLAAKETTQARADIGEGVARPHDQPENLAQHLHHFVTGQVIRGHDDYAFQALIAIGEGVHNTTIVPGLAGSNAKSLHEDCPYC